MATVAAMPEHVETPPRVASEGVGGGTLPPDERATYATDHAAATDAEPERFPAATPPWIVVGAVLLVVFVAILVFAVVAPFG